MIDYCLTSFSRWQVKQTVWAAGLGLFEDLHIFCSRLFSSWEAVFWVVDVGVGGQEVKMLAIGGGGGGGGGGEDVKPASLELPAD